jgi:hypothetical protein
MTLICPARFFQALSLARARWQEAQHRSDELEQSVLKAQSEGMRQRQDTHAIRERLGQMEHQLQLCQAENKDLQQQNLNLLTVVQAAEGPEKVALSYGVGGDACTTSPGHQNKMQPGREEKQDLALQLAQARRSIEELSKQKASLENLVSGVRHHAVNEHQMLHESAAHGGDDPRVFGLQASVVALNASLLSYQEDLRELQCQLDAERMLSTELEHVIRSALAQQADMASAQELAAAKVWSDEARLHFDKIISDLRNDSKQGNKQARGRNSGGRGRKSATASERRGALSPDAVDERKRKMVMCGIDVRRRGAASSTRPGDEDSSQDSSIVSDSSATGARDQKLRMQVMVASAEWAVVRARVSWEELVRSRMCKLAAIATVPASCVLEIEVFEQQQPHGYGSRG